MDEMKELLERARAAAPALAILSTEEKNRALLCIAARLRENTAVILEANAEDVAAARKHIKFLHSSKHLNV